MAYEYKVVPAPTKGLKARGVKSTADRFANALQTTMNELGAEGWEYQRTDTLPCEERDGIMSKTTVFQNMLVFRRPLTKVAEEPAPIEEPKALPAPETPTKDPVAEKLGTTDDAPTPVPETPSDTETNRVAAE